MFWKEITDDSGRILGRIPIRDFDEDIPPSPCTVSSISSRSSATSYSHRDNMPVTYSTPSRESRRDSPRRTRAVQWPPARSEAIQQWRDIASPTRSRFEQQRRRHRENQPRSTDSLRSDASLSSTEDPTSPDKKSRDVTANLKYLVRGFLKSFRATSSAKDGRRKKFTDQESFIPSPKVTFLIDDPQNLVCQVCQQTPLKMANTAENPGSTVPALLACGHVFCCSCIDSWLQNHSSCPFCRTTLIHTKCGHNVQPRLIAHDTIHSLPDTVPEGGSIGERCYRCVERDRRQISVRRWNSLAEQFKAARHEAEYLKTGEAIENMRKRQKAFERFPVDEYVAMTRIRHYQW
ncbi:hypothetical protein F5Y19DRAFT_438881 [Xylariaceae sp. FL1651]|nr:hypothetical protein F5Y19DRAFT_438881 [Xylariaceae sp. FL1651]